MKTTAYYEQLLRRLRQRVWDYPEHKQDQVSRLMKRCKTKCMADWQARARALPNRYAEVMWM